MQAKWPELDFLFSLTNNGSADWRVMAPSPVAALDVHYWFVMNPLLPDQTGYWENIHGLADNDLQFPKVQAALLRTGTSTKPKLDRVDGRQLWRRWRSWEADTTSRSATPKVGARSTGSTIRH